VFVTGGAGARWKRGADGEHAGRSELGAALTDGMDVVTLLANRLRLHDAAMRAPPQRPTTYDDAAEEVRYTERRMGPAALMCPDSFVDRGTIGNETVPKIIVNNTINLFLNCSQHFGKFKPYQFPSAV